MRRRREWWAALALLALSARPGLAESPAAPAANAATGPFDAFDLGNRKEPITVNANSLEYDYKRNVVVYRGEVDASQGPVRLRGDTLTVTLEQGAKDGTPSDGTQRVKQIVAEGNVRIDHGTRWATGGRAVFDQNVRTVVLSDQPVMHDGPNEVAGDRVVVYLDEDRSVVEGGRRRVKAVLHPANDGGLANTTPPTDPPAAKAPSGEKTAAQ